MKQVFLLNYTVQGIKTLAEKVTLSFYNQTIKKSINTRKFNVKGIYGMNGAGKSGIVTSVDILKNLIIHSDYLTNPLNQKNLDALINKKRKELSLEVEFIIEIEDSLQLFRYEIVIAQDSLKKYVIKQETLSKKKATSRTQNMSVVFSTEKGALASLIDNGENPMTRLIRDRSVNRLSMASVSALFFFDILVDDSNDLDLEECNGSLMDALSALYVFGQNLHVYMEQSDDHTDFYVDKILKNKEKFDGPNSHIGRLLENVYRMRKDHLNVFSVEANVVRKESFDYFKSYVRNLYDFLKLFKSDLKGIEIDKRENAESYICSLLMVYEDYRINAEFESTGIKKLIKLYSYLREMNQGGIVFIDEFDSNLHDVYLCALLEYLMGYAEGQLCFTTHNVGPMDILKQNRRSIDFLSMDQKIYSWTKSGNYSPSKLYRSGMIEGSPFNISYIDFIGIFDEDETEA